MKKSIKRRLLMHIAKYIFKIGGFKIFFKLCKTGFSMLMHSKKHTFYEIYYFEYDV